MNYARTLERHISAAGARTLLFQTWGHEIGDRHNTPSDTYAAMQARFAGGYTELGADVVQASGSRALPPDIARIGRKSALPDGST